MSRAEEYRRFAAECLRVAHDSKNPKDKALMLVMAQKWRELADKAEKEET